MNLIDKNDDDDEDEDQVASICLMFDCLVSRSQTRPFLEATIYTYLPERKTIQQQQYRIYELVGKVKEEKEGACMHACMHAVRSRFFLSDMMPSS